MIASISPTRGDVAPASGQVGDVLIFTAGFMSVMLTGGCHLQLRMANARWERVDVIDGLDSRVAADSEDYHHYGYFSLTEDCSVENHSASDSHAPQMRKVSS
jgi:hypothetical protein